MSDTACALCKTEDPAGGGDLRTLRIGCTYNLNEVSDLFVKQAAIIVHPVAEGSVPPQNLYCMRICKDCRGDFMALLRQFIATQLETAVSREVEELNPERNIPVRVDGRTMMLTEAEWLTYRDTGRPPVR